jgi:hypothetical protein
MVKKCNTGDGYDRRETVRLFTRQSNSRPPTADHWGSGAELITDISRMKLRTESYFSRLVAVGVTFHAR